MCQSKAEASQNWKGQQSSNWSLKPFQIPGNMHSTWCQAHLRNSSYHHGGSVLGGRSKSNHQWSCCRSGYKGHLQSLCTHLYLEKVEKDWGQEQRPRRKNEFKPKTARVRKSRKGLSLTWINASHFRMVLFYITLLKYDSGVVPCHCMALRELSMPETLGLPHKQSISGFGHFCQI